MEKSIYTYFYHQGWINLTLRLFSYYLLAASIPGVFLVYSVVAEALEYLVPSAVLTGLILIGGSAFSVVYLRRVAEIRNELRTRGVPDNATWQDIVSRLAPDFPAKFVANVSRKDTLHTVLYASEVELPGRNYGLWLFDAVTQLIRDDGRIPEITDDLETWMIKRSRVFGLVTLVFSPVVVMATLMWQLATALDQIRTTPSVLSARVWKPVDRFKFRDLNEVDHLFEARLVKAYPVAEQILDSTASRSIGTLANMIVVILMTILAPYVYLYLFTERREIVVITTLLTAIGVISKLGPGTSSVFLVPTKEQLDELCGTLHVPIHSVDDAIRVLDSTLEYRVVGWFRDLVDCVTSPVYFAFVFPTRTHKLVEFLRRHVVDGAIGTERVPEYKLECSKIGESIYLPASVPPTDAPGSYHEACSSSYYVPTPYNPHANIGV